MNCRSKVPVRTVPDDDGRIGESMIDRVVHKSPDLADQYSAALLAIASRNASLKYILEMAGQSDGESPRNQ